MTGMIFCGRRWSIATDDFLIIGIIDTILYLPWFCWLILVCVTYDSKGCLCGSNLLCPLLNVHLFGSCCLLGLSWILGPLFIYFSSRGTISQPHPRRHVVTLLYIKFVVSIFDIIWAIIGSCLLGYSHSCEEFSALFYVKVITIWQWVINVIRLLMVWTFFDEQGRQKSTNKPRKTVQREYFMQPIAVRAVKKWRCRFQTLCFWCSPPSRGKRDALNTFSELLAYISHDLDLACSDFLAGFLLYRHECLQRYKSEKAALASAPAIIHSDGTAVDHFPTSDMAPWMNLYLANHYFSMGMGVFGWAWAVYRNLSYGLCMLWKKLTCCFSCRRRYNNVVGDNCCGCNLAGFQISTGATYSDIVHVSFVNKVYEIPFFVMVDSSTSSVVLTARGSMSVSDALTDLSAGFASVDVAGCPSGTLCHSGVLTAARKIIDKLETRNVLKAAFEGREDYSLVITGHSLGAAVAAVLTLLLRNSYTNIRCFAFAPPPVFNKHGIEATKDYIFTVIFGNDAVPYLSLKNIQNMVKNIVSCLESCNIPKYKIFLGKYHDTNSTKSNRLEEGETSATVSSNFTAQDDVEKADGKKESETSSNHYSCSNTDFLLPGRILHIKYSKNGYRLRIASAEDYHTLVCRPKMIFHHFPQFMLNCLQQLGESTPLRTAPC